MTGPKNAPDGKCTNYEVSVMLICPDCKQRNIGVIYCEKCGSQLYRKHNGSHSFVERLSTNLDRLIGNSVYEK